MQSAPGNLPQPSQCEERRGQGDPLSRSISHADEAGGRDRAGAGVPKWWRDGGNVHGMHRGRRAARSRSRSSRSPPPASDGPGEASMRSVKSSQTTHGGSAGGALATRLAHLGRGGGRGWGGDEINCDGPAACRPPAAPSVPLHPGQRCVPPRRATGGCIRREGGCRFESGDVGGCNACSGGCGPDNLQNPGTEGGGAGGGRRGGRGLGYRGKGGAKRGRSRRCRKDVAIGISRQR